MKRKDIGLPGIITLFEDKEGSVSIIDGQHRVGMLAILSMKKAPGLQFSLDKILVEVFKNQSQLDDSIIAGDLFSDINKAEPVKLIDMPGEANRDHLRIINPVAETLEQMFPNMFKPNARCLPPHLHLDTFRELLYNSEIIKKYNIKDADKLLEWIFDRNKIMEERCVS